MNEPISFVKRKVKRAFCCPTGFLSVIAFLVLSANAAEADRLLDGFDAYLRGDYATAFAILSPAAIPDNPGIQNLVGLMIYQGRGTTANPIAAHELFHNAAELGIVDARRNLGILHTIGAPGVPVNIQEAELWFRAAAAASENVASAESYTRSSSIPAAIETVIKTERAYDGRGKQTYSIFCSGCHGFSGMRFFPYSPSFAMGERMAKSNQELMRSILRGKGLMPSWQDKLPVSELEDALLYLRELALRTGYGTDSAAYDITPDKYFIFSPAGMPDPLTPH